ncbi:EAL domain-containing protein [Sphingomonas sp. H160509]|uniref:putative bifunctional diguanylate cyclase/phosphodiesterase n=1 Tax=Sphingomonas sp. H160509 TaxID=2955313 RepID=UPI002097B759|nr:GGDEF domain-containing phosphodiesterase [Sphingomonas sp. H160509]MDD1453269.1 EAL domain-containing protein [Sphingomonas sp. H160509]
MRASEERYRLATKATDDVVWDWDFGTGLLTWSEAMFSQLGHPISPEKNHGDWWKAQIHPDDRARVSASIEKLINAGSGERWRESYRFQCGDGRYADIVDCGFLVTDENGKATRMVGAMMDFTERNRAAAALHLSEERYRYTIELGEQIAWTALRDGTLNEVGSAWTRLTGRPPKEALGTRFFRAVHVDDVMRLRSNWEHSVATGQPLNCIYRLMLHDGSFRWIRSRGAPLRDDAGAVLRWYGTTEDVHEQRLAELEVAWRASHDVLTELANRATFQKCLEAALQHTAAHGGATAVIVFDIDRFKLINDRYGHAAGDAVLRWIAGRLRALRFGTPARLGGDEFAVLLQDADQVGVEQKAHDVFFALYGIVDVDDIAIECQVSAGLAIYPFHGPTGEELLRSADLALYDAKASGRNSLHHFRPEMRAELVRHVSMLAVGREALSAELIKPFYQPKIDLVTGNVVGFEALLRWDHPTQGIQTPDTLAAAFDDRDLGRQISASMHRQVIDDMRHWLQSGTGFGHVSLNASGVDLCRPGFAQELLGRLAAAGVPASMVEIEIVESVFLGRDLDIVEEALATLSQAGISLSLDDFGTGYASLSHLQRFPVSVLKIDRSFVVPLLADLSDAPIVNAVIGLAKSFRMKTVAEGIETAEQALLLRSAGCNFGQGFLFSAARPAADVPELTRWRFLQH